MIAYENTSTLKQKYFRQQMTFGPWHYRYSIKVSCAAKIWRCNDATVGKIAYKQRRHLVLIQQNEWIWKKIESKQYSKQYLKMKHWYKFKTDTLIQWETLYKLLHCFLNSFMGRLFKPVREELERKYFAKLEWTSMVNSTWIE